MAMLSTEESMLNSNKQKVKFRDVRSNTAMTSSSKVFIPVNTGTKSVTIAQETPGLESARSFAIANRTAHRSCLVDLVHCQHCFL